MVLVFFLGFNMVREVLLGFSIRNGQIEPTAQVRYFLTQDLDALL